MKTSAILACGALLSPRFSYTEAFKISPPLQQPITLQSHLRRRSEARIAAIQLSATAEGEIINGSSSAPVEKARMEKGELIRKYGGMFAFDTKYGALNPYGIVYGFIAIGLGIPWYCALWMYQIFQTITFNRFDKKKAFPIFLNQMWGEVLMLLTGSWPKIENPEVLRNFYKEKRPAMFVANHNSWMDIPFLGYTVGWRNYKFISKAELKKVPILGKAIVVAGNVLLDRTNRRSQMKTFMSGIQWLRDGVHLATFPEGTRSKSGRLGKFKNGAFKMAHKAGAPVIPMSIVGAGKQQPTFFMFPARPSRNLCKVVLHEPIESVGKTEDELAKCVREAMISGLPDDQRPKDGK